MSYDMTIRTDEVNSKAARIQSEAADLEARIAALTTSMADLAATWTGPAASAFQHVYENWKGTAQQTRQTLEELGTSLGNAGTRYVDVEDTLRSQWT